MKIKMMDATSFFDVSDPTPALAFVPLRASDFRLLHLGPHEWFQDEIDMM
jgi:hypothetical protein